MRALLVILILLISRPCVFSADVKLTDLTEITSPSDNTWLWLDDLSEATKSRKYRFTNLVTQAQIGVDIQAFSANLADWSALATSAKQDADADLTDLADGSLSGSKVGTGINADNITSGTVAEARIHADITRDAEAAAAYQPLDADLTDLADGTLTGSKVGTGISGDNVTAGTIAEARIHADIARDSEVSAAYQPLDSDLTDLADGELTGSKVGTGINGDNVSSGTVADARIASTIARDSEVSATYAPLASPALTGNPTAPTASANDNDTSIATTAFVQTEINGDTRVFEFAISDETTSITTGTAKLTWRAPYAMTVTAVRASLSTASSSGLPEVDINEGGVSIFSTRLTIDANEKTSTTAATAAVISDSAIADDAEITFDIDTAGTGAKGLKVKIFYTK